MTNEVLRLHAGELVEVRSLREILSTLDSDGTLDRLPFMPEMKEFCGNRFRVHGRADRTCVEHHKARGMNHTVWLEEVRCDGNSHDGCKVGCLIFWKEAWLKRVNGQMVEGKIEDGDLPIPTKTKDASLGRYICQSSELHLATYRLGLWGNAKSYLQDLLFGNLTLGEFIKTIFIYVDTKIRTRSWKEECGTLLGDLKKTPNESLNLQPGEWVEVKSPEEIATTLDSLGRNKGLLFTKELLENCGKRYRVLERLDKAINERNGEMLTLNNTVKLEGATCNGMCRRGCARNGFHYWREIWLKRVNGPGTIAETEISAIAEV